MPPDQQVSSDEAKAPDTVCRAMVSFDFRGARVRTLDKAGHTWFVAADICDALDIANSRDALARLRDDEKGVGITDTLGGPQEMNVVNESGVYALAFRSRKPEVEEFATG
jgi:prophage antirepressor-like protein